MHAFVFAARSGLALTFVAAGASKFSDLKDFEQTLGALLAFPRTKGIRAVAVAVAFAEVPIGVASFVGVAPKLINGFVLIAALLFVFVALTAVRRGPRLECRCFGSLTNAPFTRRTVARNVILSVAALGVLIGGLHYPLDRQAFGTTVLLLFSVAVFGVACAEASRALAMARAGSAG